MKTLPLLASLCLLASFAHAQETTTSGALAQEASWTALQSRINATNGNVSMLRVDVDTIKKCGDQGKIWTSKGCKDIPMPDPAVLDIQTHTKTLCKQGGNHTVTASCPAGQRLLGCGGGPGDQEEYGEYWVLMPDFKKNRCIGYAGTPWCNPTTYYGQTIVTAICYKP